MIGTGVHIMYICLWTKKNLNRTIAIDSSFQTFAVGLLVKFIECTTLEGLPKISI